MVEALMYVAIGFLSAVLAGLAVVPLVHNRAVRLTVRDLEGALPISMGELQAEKDALRAEFAMAVRRVELANEQLRSRLANLMVRISEKENLINQLKATLQAGNEPLAMVYEKAIRKRETQPKKAA
jgi:regulator of replication initiation timing